MTRRPLWAGRTLALLGVLFVALSLRTPVAAMSPILDRIGADIRLDAFVLGLIGAAPPLAFAASGLMAPAIARKIGLEQALLASLIAMALGHLGRSLAPEAVTLTLGTVLALVGVGVGNVLLPPVVRRYFPDRVGLVTSLYATLMSISTAIPALVAVPVADAAGWRTSLGMWLLVSLIAAVPWVAVLLQRRPEPAGPASVSYDRPVEPVHTGPIETGAIELGDAQAAGTEAAIADRPAPARLGVRMLRSPTAWSVAVIFGSSSLAAYASFAWLPLLLVDRAGASEAAAGAMLALYAFMGFPAGLLVPVIAARFPRRVPALVLLGGVFFVVGYLGLLLVPTTATVVWVASAGLGPLLFPLALVLINLRSASPESTVALSGFVQTIGYIVGAIGPFVVGLLHDATGGWTVPLVFLLAAVVAILPAAAILGRGRTVDAEL
jgi:CP family cyanate transporter-like MFS transporter